MLLDHLPVLNPFLMTMPRTFLEGKSFFFFTDSPTGLVNVKQSMEFSRPEYWSG